VNALLSQKSKNQNEMYRLVKCEEGKGGGHTGSPTGNNQKKKKWKNRGQKLQVIQKRGTEKGGMTGL